MHSAETNLPNGNHETVSEDIGESLWASVVILDHAAIPRGGAGNPDRTSDRRISSPSWASGCFALPTGILTSNFMEAYQHARDSAGQNRAEHVLGEDRCPTGAIALAACPGLTVSGGGSQSGFSRNLAMGRLAQFPR